MADPHADEPIPNSLPKWLPMACLLMMALIVGCWSFSCYRGHKAGKAEERAAQAHESSVIHAAQGATYDQQAEAQAPALQAADREVERLRAEVARLRRPAPRPDPKPIPTEPSIPQPVSSPVDLAPGVAKLDELVKAQDREISGLKAQVVTITKARDSWKLAAQDSGREALQLRASLAAKEGLLKAERWKGRIEGFAVGFAGGYVTGRLQ